ncbi:hypothetical protein [Sulfurimonas sp. HSL3-7]|uniref:hypothetical protein n=1 Tax=Sulfonitrofixus jiaomeiensis TaxID=3131938 RepID=UPI0031F88525
MNLSRASAIEPFNRVLFSFLLFTPILLKAAGMGVSVPVTITETERLNYSNVNLSDATYHYEPSAGLGFVFDSNIGQNRDFSYRLNFEYTLSKLESSNRLYSERFSKHKYNIVNTFAFSVYHARYVRFWVGPRINVQFEHMSSSSNIRRQNSYGIGLAAATGVNVMLGRTVALAADLGYHGSLLFGGERYRDYDGTTIEEETHYSVYGGTNKGLTARFYLLFRFGERYEQNEEEFSDRSVIDDSL